MFFDSENVTGPDATRSLLVVIAAWTVDVSCKTNFVDASDLVVMHPSPGYRL